MTSPADENPVAPSLPTEATARLFALTDLVEASKRRGEVALRQVRMLQESLPEDPDLAVHQLLAADEIYFWANARSVIADDAAEELAAALAGESPSRLNTLIAAAHLGDVDAAAELERLYEQMPSFELDPVVAARGVVDDMASVVAQRIPTLEQLTGQVCLGVQPADSRPQVVAVDVNACGTAELRIVAAGWEAAAVDWKTCTAVVVVPAALAAYLGAHRAVTVLGPAVEVRFDPIPFVLRIADHLGSGAALGDVYEAALVSGATCRAAQQAAARHLGENGDLA